MRPSTPVPLAAAGLAVLAAVSLAPPAAADHGSLPPGRVVREHVVRPGETATGLAVRYHAWTAELIAHNHLGTGAALRVGQRLAIPVVRSAVRPATRDRDPDRDRDRERVRGRDRAGSRPGDPSRERVRAAVAGVSHRRGVDPQLALAVSWQESGWQMDHVSAAGAIGAMQVLPTTADWMEWYVGRRLHPRRLHDNVLTGVTLLRVLAEETRRPRHRVGAYYQGLGAVRDHGLYGETRAYVANVFAIKRRLERGRPPA